MESNTNNISSVGLHGLDQRQRRSETSEEVDVRQGRNALGSLLLSTGLTPSHNRSVIVAHLTANCHKGAHGNATSQSAKRQRYHHQIFMGARYG